MDVIKNKNDILIKIIIKIYKHNYKGKMSNTLSLEDIKNIEDVKDKPLDYYWLSNNPNITIEYVKNNPDKPWDWNELSSNPNITIEYVNDNPDKSWDWNELSSNKFKYERCKR